MLRFLLAAVLLVSLAPPTFSIPRDPVDRWEEMAPPARAGHVAAYDARNRRLIIFGGSVGGTIRGDVWSLSVSRNPRWERLNPFGEGPSPRVGAAAAYDPEHDRLLIHGGKDDSGIDQDDLWELSLRGRCRWRRLATVNAPPGRWRHTLTLVSSNRVLLFGGIQGSVQGGTRLADAWSLSLDSLRWSKLSPQGSTPAARSGHTAVYSPDLGGVLVFAGETYFTQETADVWLLRLGPVATWEPVVTRGDTQPCGGQGNIAAWDERGHQMIVFVGRPSQFWTCATDLGIGVWALSGPDFAWSPLQPTGRGPTTRSYAVGAFDPGSRRLFIQGGGQTPVWHEPTNDAKFSDAWSLSIEPEPEWRPIVETPRFLGLSGPRLVMDPRRDQVIAQNDTVTQTFDLQREVWEPMPAPGGPPSHRNGVTVMDTRRGRMFFFGGRKTFAPFERIRDTWALDPGRHPNWTKIPTAGDVPATEGGSAIYDPMRDRILLCANGAVWSLSLSERDSVRWGQVASFAPALIDPVVVYDSKRDQMVIFSGGENTPDAVFGTNGCYGLRLDGPPVWSVLSAPSRDSVLPTPRLHASGVYDEEHDRLLVVGGSPSGIISPIEDDAWSFSMSTHVWSRLDDESPRPHWTLATALIDERRNRMAVIEDVAIWALDLDRWASRRRHVSTVLEGDPMVAPLALELQGARPNPSAGEFSISFTLPDRSPAALELFDVSGRRVWGEDVSALGPGRHALRVTPSHALSPGLYLIRLVHGSETRSRKVVRISP